MVDLTPLVGKNVCVRLVGRDYTLEGSLIDATTLHGTYKTGDYAIQVPGGNHRVFTADHVASCDQL